MATTLHLVVPGLLGPWPSDHFDPAFPWPAAPALEWLLSRAVVGVAPASIDAALFQLFDLPEPAGADLPVAAITRLADGAEMADDGWWLRVDPVHLRPDLRGAYLVDARALAIEPAEAQALVTAFNQTFATDGLQIDALRPDRWYLRLAADPGLRTHALESVIGRDIKPLLPYGPAKRRWHALLTEVQMLLHTHPINRARENRNQPLLNGVWFWGGGVCPTSARSPATTLYAGDPLTRGLARLANAAVAPVPERASDWLEAAGEESDGLVVLDATRYDAIDGDFATWAEHIAGLECDWFTFCRRWLKTTRLTTLHLHPGSGRIYTVTNTARWRFWQYPRPLRTHCQTALT
ncbi:MAG TPA: hypothetical protein PKY50_03885 [Candidatus Competibacter sp.]|nr:hypothetical protein [Candidatus Competibacter sp.]